MTCQRLLNIAQSTCMQITSLYMYASQTKNPGAVGSALEGDLERVSSWIAENGLTMNKKSLACLAAIRKDLDLSFQYVLCPQSHIGTTHCLLLWTFNFCNMNFHFLSLLTLLAHCHQLCLASIRTPSFLPHPKMLYSPLVLPHLDYCPVVSRMAATTQRQLPTLPLTQTQLGLLPFKTSSLISVRLFRIYSSSVPTNWCHKQP